MIPISSGNCVNNAKGQDPVHSFPEELVLKVFSYLNLATLGTLCLVSKEWKRLADDPLPWKTAIYREKAFGSDKWARCFGEDAVKNEDREEEFSSLPWKDFIADGKKFSSLYPVKVNLMLVRLPKTLNGALTLKNLDRLAKKYFSNESPGGGVIPSSVLEKLGDKSINKSYWVLMTKRVLPESSYVNQQKIIAGLAEKSLTGYGMSGTLESVVCILSQYFLDSEKRLFSSPWNFTICKEEFQGYYSVIRGLTSTGLDICFGVGKDDFGFAVLRKF